MASYLIFFDNEKSQKDLLTKRQLDGLEAAHDARLTWNYLAKGPGDTSGMLATWANPAIVMAPEYRPAEQTWHKAPGMGGVWFGVWNAQPPRPADLQRIRMYESNPVQLADGQVWQIPIAKSLPHYWGLNEAGEFCATPKDPYLEFCREAEAVYQMFLRLAAREDQFEISAKYWYICRALNLNYRLCPQMISILQLLDDTAGFNVLAASVEVPQVEAVMDEKKNPAEPAITPAGSLT